MRRQVTKLEKPIKVFKRGAEWKTESPDTVAAIYRALDDPIRLIILELLEDEPIRQIDLTRLVNKATGRKYDVASIMHHLNLLEKAGLIAHEEFSWGQTTVKMIYRTKDVRLQTYERPKLEISPAPIKNVEEWLHEFRRKRSQPI